MTKSVLLYGDSIFWGLNGKIGFRHDAADRVDSVVRRSLGGDFEVASEGLRGRTMFGENGFFPKRNGLEQFGPILASHLPLDAVVIMLGINDLNTKTKHTPAEIAGALADYETETKFWCDFMRYPMPKFIVISPTDIDEATFNDFQRSIFSGAAPEVAHVADELQQYADKNGWGYIDSRQIAAPHDTDGIHLDVEDSRKLGEAIAEKIKTI